MLSPTSLSGFTSAASWAGITRAASPSPATPRPVTPISPRSLTLPDGGGGGQQDGTSPSRTLPRGSILDLSV
jgi:hypothetical protein